MEKLTGKSQTIQLTNNLSVKKQYLSQNKDLFGEEIFLELPQKSSQSKTVIIDDTWYHVLQDEFKKNYWHSLTETVTQGEWKPNRNANKKKIAEKR